MTNYSLLLNFILFINSIKYSLLSKWDKNNPLLKEGECVSSCCITNEINNGKCIIENEIIIFL